MEDVPQGAGALSSRGQGEVRTAVSRETRSVMAAEKAKQRRRGYRKKNPRTTGVYSSTPFTSKSKILAKLSRELGGEVSLGRTRAQTVQTSRKISRRTELSPGLHKKEYSLCMNDITEATITTITGDVEPEARAEGDNSEDLIHSVITRKSSSMKVCPTETSPTGPSALTPVEPDEEKDEFFMAPERVERSNSPAPSDDISPANSERDKENESHKEPPTNSSVSDDNAQRDNISHTLSIINSKLVKLDTLENLNLKLEGNLSKVQSRVEDVSKSIDTVKADLSKYDQKWEETIKGLSDRISKLETSSQSWEKRWELQRESVNGDCKVLQTSIDSNSKKVIELETLLDSANKKWDSLDQLENKIKEAADSKFQRIQAEIREDLRKELLEEAKLAAKAPGLSPEDLANVQEELSVQMKAQNEEFLNKIQAQHTDPASDPQYNRLIGQAFSNRHNILIFGLPDSNSPEKDLREVHTFLKDRMGLSGLKIAATFRLGAFRQDANRPRPLVIKFGDIKDRWRVWNNKRKIKFDKDHPIRIQEDLPQQLREDIRVMQRIAKVAMGYPDRYKDVKVKDFKLSINGYKYGIEEIHKLPAELQPEAVYTPRSNDSVVFFTKHSPLSNHHQAPFTLKGKVFSCVEQYLAFSKAILAQDTTQTERAMELSDPADHKVILNNLRSVVQERWAELAPDIILPAIRAKFSQNERLSNFLIETHPLAIGEASRDSIWGVGLQLEHKDVMDVSKWEPHGNLLGNTLARVQAELIHMFNNSNATLTKV